MNNGKYMFGAGLLLFAVGVLVKRKSSTSPDTIQITHTDMNMQTNTEISLGYRNNNPLNIRISSEPWQGKIPNEQNTDGVFEQFESMAYGYRAAMALLRTYVNERNCNTLAKIITRWAPPKENRTADYINNVSKIMGLSPDTYINPYSKAQMTSLVYAMSISENGRKIMPDTDSINKGWNLYIS